MTNSYVPRVCLKCNKSFPSHSRFNRICPKCVIVNDRILAKFSGQLVKRNTKDKVSCEDFENLCDRSQD